MLKFLRVDDVGESNYSFQKLLLPEYADVFTNLVSKLGVRTIKSQIQDELALPPQERFVVPVKLTPVEMYNYRTKFGEALAEVQAHMDPARLTKDWTVDRMMMVSKLFRR